LHNIKYYVILSNIVKRTFVQTKIFSGILDEKEAGEVLEEIEEKILSNPECGDAIPGCGGVRKLRVKDPKRGKGTRGGLRILFLDLPHKGRVYLLYAYGKDESEDISPDEKKKIREIAASLKEE